MNEPDIEREELIEQFGVHFETVYHLPPLASRILATIILDACSRKFTFEDLLEMTGASKSSISTNLNLLLKLGKITYYTLPGDRKKYYRPSAFSERFDNYKKIISFEKEILERMIRYRQQHMSCSSEKSEMEKTLAYKGHLLQMENLISNSIEKFREIETKL